jgi:hypothetical protein
MFIPGSGMFMPDPGSEFFSSPIRIKEFKYFLTQKIVSKLSEIWSGLFIVDPDFLPIPHPGSGSALKKRLGPTMRRFCMGLCSKGSTREGGGGVIPLISISLPASSSGVLLTPTEVLHWTDKKIKNKLTLLQFASPWITNAIYLRVYIEKDEVEDPEEAVAHVAQQNPNYIIGDAVSCQSTPVVLVAGAQIA